MTVSGSSKHSSEPGEIYDLAVSYAGEDRPIAEEIATRLRAAGYEVFYDRFEQAQANLLGEDLTSRWREIKCQYIGALGSAVTLKHGRSKRLSW